MSVISGGRVGVPGLWISAFCSYAPWEAVSDGSGAWVPVLHSAVQIEFWAPNSALPSLG